MRCKESLKYTGLKREEYQKITTSSPHKSKVCLFPRLQCILSTGIADALDIMDHINIDYAFVSGLDHCCGDVRICFTALLKSGQRRWAILIETVSYQPETLVLWCPTCRCRFQELDSYLAELPFNIVFFPQFVAEHIENSYEG